MRKKQGAADSYIAERKIDKHQFCGKLWLERVTEQDGDGCQLRNLCFHSGSGIQQVLLLPNHW